MAKPTGPIALIILDGWGHREETQYNPIAQVDTPFIDSLFQHYPHTLLCASGEAVGLPKGQMGNSEVGHLHIGAGRKIPQDLTRINQSIEDGSFQKNPTFLKAIERSKQLNTKIHVLGLLSPGGVHSHENQINALMKMLNDNGAHAVFHALLDGRDTPPKSALHSLKKLNGHIASIIGRYYAMDRDRRWQRTQIAYDLLTAGKADYCANTAEEALAMAYERGETDEFVKPTVIANADDAPVTIQDHDIVIFMNFRADRARQLSHALIDGDFNDFERHAKPKIELLITLTSYDSTLNAEPAFPEIKLNEVLGEYIAEKGLHQLRIAETEKYAHVTYFINGGRETPFKNEDRILIPSPKIATYDLKPEMSAIEVTDKMVESITSEKYDVIICNYANPDMIGHTGKTDAAEKAVSVMDQCLSRVIKALQDVGGEALITADHGNIEIIYDEKHDQPHTAHTNNLVPLIYVGRAASFQQSNGGLDDIAPTLLALLDLKPPREMTGHNLLKLDASS